MIKPKELSDDIIYQSHARFLSIVNYNYMIANCMVIYQDINIIAKTSYLPNWGHIGTIIESSYNHSSMVKCHYIDLYFLKQTNIVGRFGYLKNLRYKDKRYSAIVALINNYFESII